MRMSIDFVGAAVGRPAGMAYPRRSMDRRSPQQVLQIADPALGAAALDGAACQRRHACRVISAVFQPLQAFDNPVDHIFSAVYAYDFAHFARLRTWGASVLHFMAGASA